MIHMEHKPHGPFERPTVTVRFERDVQFVPSGYVVKLPNGTRIEGPALLVKGPTRAEIVNKEENDGL